MSKAVFFGFSKYSSVTAMLLQLGVPSRGRITKKSRAGDRLNKTPKAPRPRHQRRRGGWEWGWSIPLPS